MRASSVRNAVRRVPQTVPMGLRLAQLSIVQIDWRKRSRLLRLGQTLGIEAPDSCLDAQSGFRDPMPTRAIEHEARKNENASQMRKMWRTSKQSLHGQFQRPQGTSGTGSSKLRFLANIRNQQSMRQRPSTRLLVAAARDARATTAILRYCAGRKSG